MADVGVFLEAVEDELGVSPNTLSARLSELVEAGLLTREAYDEMPPPVEYRPTPKAEDLFPAFGHFHRWAMDNELAPAEGSGSSAADR